MALLYMEIYGNGLASARVLLFLQGEVSHNQNVSALATAVVQVLPFQASNAESTAPRMATLRALPLATFLGQESRSSMGCTGVWSDLIRLPIDHLGLSRVRRVLFPEFPEHSEQLYFVTDFCPDRLPPVASLCFC